MNAKTLVPTAINVPAAILETTTVYWNTTRSGIPTTRGTYSSVDPRRVGVDRSIVPGVEAGTGSALGGAWLALLSEGCAIPSNAVSRGQKL